MKAVLQTKSVENDPFLESLIACITSINSAEHFSDHLGKTQSEQKTVVRLFQNVVYRALATTFPRTTWFLEHVQNPTSKEAIDIFGKNTNALVVIELDKHRADQVSKKFVSRSAMFRNGKLYYISLCYPGTEGMNLSECGKYFGYCADLSKRLGNVYAGFVIQKTTGPCA